MRQARFLLGFVVLAAALVGGWVVYSQAPQSARSVLAETANQEGAGVLDGMSFSSELGLAGESGDIDDRLVFEDGLFVSTECDRRCGYPPQPYFTRQVGDRIEFTSIAHCTYKDATIVWQGTVEDGAIKGIFTWTVNRWYWTIEKEFWFEGELAEASTPVASN